MKKELAKIKATSKNEVDYISKITVRLLEATNFSNKQIVEIIKKLIAVAETINKTEDKTKNKELSEKLDKVKEAIKERKNEVKILNALEIERPEWIKELKPKDNKKIEDRLFEIKKAISEIEYPELNIPGEFKVKKPDWWDIKARLTETSLSMKQFMEETLSHKIFKIKSDKPLNVVITDKQGKSIDLTALGGIITGSGSGIDTSDLATEAKQDDLIGNISPRKDLEGLGNKTVGMTRVEIVIAGTPHTIRLRADTANTGIIYIGKSGVLADGSNDFVRLESGDEIIIDYDDTTNALYAISDVASQKINLGIIL